MKTYADIASDGGSDVLGQVAAQAGRVREALAGVRHVVALMSGKGGVGKSTMSVNLAHALARSGMAVGLVDGDINGSSIGRMAGVRDRVLERIGDRILPPETAGAVKVMTMDLFLRDESSPVVWEAPTQRSAYAWRGLMEAGALRELIADTAWGELDYLVVDLPPGSDRLPNLADLLPTLSGAIAVTVPSAVSVGVVARSIRMAQEHLHTPILGLIENMAASVCPACGHEDALFPGDHVHRLLTEFGLPILGSIPFDPLLTIAADEGRPYLEEHPDRPAAKALHEAAVRLRLLLR